MVELPVGKKSLGQHWLSDEGALLAICAAGEIKPDDTVLEVGPGTGTLTEKLLDQGAGVVAVELDPNLAKNLSTKFSGNNLYLIEKNILEFDFGQLPPDYKVIANIPYYLTSKLIRNLSETANQAERVVLLVQKEVAQRVAAKPGGMSLLSVSAQYYWDVSRGIHVPARLFTPPPKVDSQVIILRRRSQPLFEGIDTKLFFRLVKAGFVARRKTLLNSLSGGLRISREQGLSIIKRAQLLPAQRPQELSLDDWHKLYQAFVDGQN